MTPLRAAGLALLLPALQAAELDADVVVVGAGLSGLWAATELRKNSDLKVVVLEGRDRVGGRTFSQDPGTDDAIDFGAHWVGRTQYQVLEVLKRLNFTTYTQWTTGTKVLEIDGKVSHYKSTIPTLPILQELNFGMLYLEAQHAITKIPRNAPWNASNAKRYDPMTVESFCTGFPWRKETEQLISSSAKAIFGKDLSDVGALQFLHYAACAGGVAPLLDASPGGAQEFKVVGGTQQISMTLAKELDVRFNATVVGVNTDEDGQRVTIRTLDGRSFTAKRAILAVPPHLAAGIWFQPPLSPKKAHLLTRMTQGHLIKAIVGYETPFWRTKGFSGEVVSSTFPLSICYDDTTPGGMAALICFLGGSDAGRLSPLPKEQRLSLVTDALAKYFGAEAKNATNYFEFDWGLEPLTGGCPVGSMNAGVITQWGDALRETHGPVHFAGTETATWFYGFMNGALQAGTRTAIEVLEALQLPVPQEMVAFRDLGEPDLAAKEEEVEQVVV